MYTEIGRIYDIFVGNVFTAMEPDRIRISHPEKLFGVRPPTIAFGVDLNPERSHFLIRTGHTASMDTQASVTARVDENDKRPFSAFCSGIGLNTTAAINLYIKGFSSGTPDFL